MTKSITWQTEKRKLSDLLPWERNPRQLTESQAEHLEESLSKFGLVDPPAINTDNVIIGGHQRRNIMGLMKEYGNGAEIDVRVPSRTLTEREVEELNIRLNKNTGSFDFDALANNFEVDDLMDWGFEPFELGIEDVVDDTDAEPQFDRAEELREKWGVELGQLWQLGDHRLICGDCTDDEVVDRLIEVRKPKYGLHDPPYGINVVGVGTSDSGGSKPFGKGSIGFHNTVKTNAYFPVTGDDKPFNPNHLLNASEHQVLWGANYYADKLPPKKGWIVWDKKRREDWRDNFSDCELAWTSLPNVTRIFRHTWMGMVQEGEREERVHPTQKPVALMEKIMYQLFKEEGDVIDFYSGSGPVLMAAERLGRKCCGVEIEPKYVAVTLQRYYDAFGLEPELIGKD